MLFDIGEQTGGDDGIPMSDQCAKVDILYDLASKFECIANVGEDGDSDEYMGDALIALLAEGQQNTGCNANFIRDDAMLIIVMLTDENDSSGTNENQWFQAVVDAKGSEENVVVLSLI